MTRGPMRRTRRNIIANYARQHDIGLVLRYNGDKADPNRREDVLRDINKIV